MHRSLCVCVCLCGVVCVCVLMVCDSVSVLLDAVDLNSVVTLSLSSAANQSHYTVDVCAFCRCQFTSWLMTKTSPTCW